MTHFASHLPYWRNETEELKGIVESFSAYINNLYPGAIPQTQKAPTAQEITLLRNYIVRWANYDDWKVTQENQEFLQDVRKLAQGIESFPDARQWLKMANGIGIDPF